MSRLKETAAWGWLPGAIRSFWNGNKLRRAVPVAGNSMQERNTSINTAFAGKTNDEWLAILQRSVHEPYIDGVELPRFPASFVQMGYNGAADADGILRAHGFWLYADGYGRALGNRLTKDSRVLDIGCGWGRITRFFARDVAPENIHGVDIDPRAVVLCQFLGVPGQFIQTQPGARLPFADGFFSCIVAASVFTHLPEPVASSLIGEISRVAAPGAIIVFTVEDSSFLKNFEIEGIENHGERWRLLSRYKPMLADLRSRYANGEYQYLVTNDDEGLRKEFYGDALVPREWIEKNWARHFKLVRFEASAPPVDQAIVVGRKE
jgi:SAM-dependent methyltransferase